MKYDPMPKPDPADDEPTLPPLEASGRESEPTHTWAERTAAPRAGQEDSKVGLVPGTAFGPFHIESKLGQGGMGAVYKGVHSRLNKVMAIKVLSESYTQDADAVSRFEREMRAVGALSHPNIVQAHDAGEVDGIHYLAMEFVEGSDLYELVRMKGPMSVPQACKAIRQAALALGAAHQAGLVHRDVKPSNLFLARNGQIKLLDLGLARLADETHAGGPLTSTGQTFGTPDYMAPEQWENVHEVDGRSDLYALGCTLFYLLTGRPPFGDTHRSAANKMKGHVLDATPDLRAARPEVPNEVVAIYNKLMAKQPDDRYQTGAELAQALQRVSASEGSAEKAKPVSPTATAKAKSDDQQQRSDAAALLQLAEQLIDRFDYAEAVRTLEQIPPRHRSEAIQSALKKASESLSELQELQVDIDRALAQKNFVELKTGVKRYLELHPGNARMKTLWKRIQTYGNKPAVFQSTSAAPMSGGTSWISGLVLAAGVLLLAGGTYWLTRSTLDATKSGTGQTVGSPEDSKWNVVLTIDDPTAKVVIDGEPVTLSGLRTELMLKPGKHPWSASVAGATSQSGTLEVRRQQANPLTISLRNGSVPVVYGTGAPAISLAEMLAAPDWEWTTAAPVAPEFSTPENERVHGLSTDERLLLHSLNGRLLLSRRKDLASPFGPPEAVEVVPDDVRHGASLTGDGLVIAYTKIVNKNDNDLWMVSRPSIEVPFGSPERLPDAINTNAPERHPVLSPDGLSLYFTSGRENSPGVGDIWVTQRPARDQPFGTPTRVPPPVSSDGFDIPCWVSPDGLVLCGRQQVQNESKSLVWTRSAVGEPFVAGPRITVWPDQLGIDLWLSPDGKRLYMDGFRTGRTDSDYDVVVANRIPKVETAPTESDDPADLVVPTGQYALQFDGVDDYVSIPSLRYDGSHPLTVEAWMLGEGEGTAWLMGGSSAYRLAYSTNDWRLYRILPDNSATALAVPRRLNKKFLHLCMTVDGDQWRFFMNGREGTEDAGSGRFPSMAKAETTLGGNARTAGVIDGGFFRGQIRSLRISKTLRYTQNFRPPGRFENDPETMVLYQLGEGMGETVKDASGNGHDGQIHGATWVQPTATNTRRAQP